MKRNVFLVIALLIAATMLGIAESTDCNHPVVIVPDGRPTYQSGWFYANTNYYWAFWGQKGHSYSVEFLYDSDNDTATGGPSAGGQTYNVGDNFCAGFTTTLNYTQTNSMAPELAFPSIRVSFVAGTSGLYGLWLKENVNAARYSFRVVDTTMFNPRWSTWSGFGSTWGFNNTSGTAISGTFTIYDGSGNVLKTVSVTVPAGKVKFYASGPSDLNLPNNVAGTAMFAYVGPPGAIQVDAYMVSGNGASVIPTKFEPRNAQW